jgi:hypothetical protein
VARANCVWNGKRGNVADEWGFQAEDNVVADPQFANRAGKDFRLDPSGACARLVPAAARTETAVRLNAGPSSAPGQAKPAGARPAKKKQRSRPRDRVRRLVGHVARD